MLTASILKIFYWPGARYDIALLVQALIMVGVQVLLLKVALDNRPAWRGEGPFRGVAEDDGRPWGFWRVCLVEWTYLGGMKNLWLIWKFSGGARGCKFV